jgi:hypothetical protein
MERAAYWNRIFATKTDTDVSWYEADPSASMALVAQACSGTRCSVIDIGSGTSRLVDRLLDGGYGPVAALDIADHALTGELP